MTIVNIIPARLASKRFPNKPLAKIAGIPMIGHCYHRGNLVKSVQSTYVATCDDKISNYISSIGGKAIMTSKTHTRACTRTAEAVDIIEKQLDKKIDIVVMIQGDEPLVSPEAIENMVSCFREPEVEIVNLMVKTFDKEFVNDKNNVKVVFDQNYKALYFSREAIPSNYNITNQVAKYVQTGIIAFKRNALLKFDETDETPLEISESVDMNRIIETGGSIKMVETEELTFGVDTPNELDVASKLILKDKFFKFYS